MKKFDIDIIPQKVKMSIRKEIKCKTIQNL